MPVIWIPALLRDLTGGLERVSIPGQTVRQVIDGLDERYPGMKSRLMAEDRIKSNIIVVVDGEVSGQRLRHRLDEHSEVHFLPAIGGG